MQLTFMYYWPIACVVWWAHHFLVGVGTSFLVVVGQHEDSWVGSILRHIGWTETHYTKTHVEDSSYNTKLPVSWRTLSPLVIS